MGLRGFSTINFYADDVTEAVRWYAQFLGMDAYFERPGPDGRVAYAEFRIGDHEDELGIIDRRFAPASGAAQSGGAIMYWHVDDLDETVQTLVSLGAEVYQPKTEHGDDSGFITASMIDPFGNVLGVMSNPHYIEVLAKVGSL